MKAWVYVVKTMFLGICVSKPTKPEGEVVYVAINSYISYVIGYAVCYAAHLLPYHSNSLANYFLASQTK